MLVRDIDLMDAIADLFGQAPVRKGQNGISSRAAKRIFRERKDVNFAWDGAKGSITGCPVFAYQRSPLATGILPQFAHSESSPAGS